MKILTALVRGMPAPSAMLCAIVLMAGCGQKGALYLPEDAPPAGEPFSACDVPTAPCRQSTVPPPATQTPAPASAQPLPESSTAPGAYSTESNAP